MHIRRDISFEENTIEGGEGMKLKVGYEKIKGFSDPVKRAGRNNDWITWAILAIISLSGIIYLIFEAAK